MLKTFLFETNTLIKMTATEIKQLHIISFKYFQAFNKDLRSKYKIKTNNSLIHQRITKNIK